MSAQVVSADDGGEHEDRQQQERPADGRPVTDFRESWDALSVDYLVGDSFIEKFRFIPETGEVVVVKAELTGNSGQ
jgi:hypothetical protein